MSAPQPQNVRSLFIRDTLDTLAVRFAVIVSLFVGVMSLGVLAGSYLTVRSMVERPVKNPSFEKQMVSKVNNGFKIRELLNK